MDCANLIGLGLAGLHDVVTNFHFFLFYFFNRKDVISLNETCCPVYAKHKMRVGYSFHFEKGDKICPTRNANVTDVALKREWEKKKAEREKRRKEEEKRRQKEEEKRQRKETKRQMKAQKKNKKKHKKSKKKKSKHDREEETEEDNSQDADDVRDDPVMTAADWSDEEDGVPPPYTKRICNGEIFYITEVRIGFMRRLEFSDKIFSIIYCKLSAFCN